MQSGMLDFTCFLPEALELTEHELDEEVDCNDKGSEGVDFDLDIL